jgi:Mg2+ and Co2+ transporter CorA
MFYRKTTVKEAFTVQRTLVNPVEDHQRDRFATERCDALYTTDESLSEHATTTMTAYIGGHRLQRWKPIADDPAASAKQAPNKDYCYFYDDDVAMQSNKCDMTNPLFKDPQGIITGAFESEYADQTHTIPIKKCIIEIDRTAAKDITKLDALWNHMGHFNCDQVTQSIRRDIEYTKAQTTATKRDHETLQNEYRANSNLASSREFSLNQCSKSNIDYSKEYPVLVSQFMTLSERLRQERAAVEQQSRDHATLQNDALTMHMQVNDAKREHDTMKGNATSCTKTLRECETSKESHLFNYNIMQQANVDVRDHNIILSEDLNQWTASYLTACNLVQTCSNDVQVQRDLFANYDRHWTTSNAMYVTCQRERVTYSNDTTLYMNQFESYSNQLAKCRDDLFENGKILVVEQEDLANCRERVAFLHRVIGETQAKIKGLKGETDELIKQTDGVRSNTTNCQSQVGSLQSTIAELEKRRDAMLRELEALNAAANAASKASYDGQLEVIQKTVEATQKAAELSCQSVKSRANGLRDQITQIKAAQIEAAGMPKINMTAACPSSCTPSRKQCILYRNLYCKYSIVDYQNQTKMYYGKRNETLERLLIKNRDIMANGFPSTMPAGIRPFSFMGTWHGILMDYSFDKDDSAIALFVYPPFSVAKEIIVKTNVEVDNNGFSVFVDSSLSNVTLVELHQGVRVHNYAFKPGTVYQFIWGIANWHKEGHLKFKDWTGLDEVAANLMPPTGVPTSKWIIKW